MNTPFEFFDMVMNTYLDRIHNYETDNYDAERYSYDGVDRSTVFDKNRHKEYLYFFISNHEALYGTWQLLADKASRDLFVELLLFRLLGHLHVKLPSNTPRHWSLRQQVAEIPSAESELDTSGIFGKLRHFDSIEFEGEKLRLDCWASDPVWPYYLRQYYYDRDGVEIQPERGDHVIDGGGFIGDTALAFAASVGDKGKVHSFEPLENNLEVLRYNRAQNDALSDRIVIHHFGLSDHETDCDAIRVGDGHSIDPGFHLSGLDSSAVPVRSIDGMLVSKKIERVDFIKMDIEGAELAALHGAGNCLRTFRPKLAISLYHKPQDFFEIPRFIAGLDLGYQMYLDHYTVHFEETVLYAHAR